MDPQLVFDAMKRKRSELDAVRARADQVREYHARLEPDHQRIKTELARVLVEGDLTQISAANVAHRAIDDQLLTAKAEMAELVARGQALVGEVQVLQEQLLSIL